MTPALPAAPSYTRAERLTDGAIHVVGLVAALAAVPVLITLTVVLRPDAAAISGTGIYGATLLAMLLASAVYHMAPFPRWRDTFRRLDHSAIFLKIAGTYTPFTLLSGHGAPLLAGLWACAAAGIALTLVVPQRFQWLSLGLYLAMGWAGVAAWSVLFANLPGSVLLLALIGGLLYTGGIGFYLAKRLPFRNAIWHGFVLAASVAFYAAVTMHLVQTAGAMSQSG